MNFSANLNRRLFSVTERVACNLKGKLGKGKMDPEKVKYIKKNTLKMFPLETRRRRR